DQPHWLDLLDPDAANLETAIERAAETDPDRALRLCVALTAWWKLRGRFAAAELAYARALDAADTKPSSVRARALWARAYLLTWAGRFEDGIPAAQQALAVAEEVEDQLAIARALMTLGWIQVFPDPVGCRPTLERSMRLAREVDDEWCLLAATQFLAYSYLFSHEFAEAERLLNEAFPAVEQARIREALGWH